MFGSSLLSMLCTFVGVSEESPLGSLDLSKMRQGWGTPHVDQSVEGHPLTIAGRAFATGVGTHAASMLWVSLDEKAERFEAWVGVDDEVGKSTGTVEFRVIGDGKDLWRSGVLKTGDAAKRVEVALRGVKTMILLVSAGTDGQDYDHADWAEAKIVMQSGKPEAIEPPREEADVRTPKPGPKPRITGPKVFGVRPGHPILFRFTATGTKPMRFECTGLPPGAALDAATGQLSGKVSAPGEHRCTVTATNAEGKASREFRLVIGSKIALTPPLGWNSWNCFAADVDDAKVRAAAQAMVSSGLADHGWSNINIDDCWEIKPGSDDAMLQGEPRDPDGMINTNKKFPDMKALCAHIHSLGLRAGLYSSPGPLTCAGFTASYQFEEKDAQRWAQWGFDYVKYDWCSYGDIAKDDSLEELQKPYRVMRAALDKVDRDIVFSLCQYGMGKVWEWGADVGGNCWRTTGDIVDTWDSMAGIGFAQNGHEVHAGPGHWNDPDMLVVGVVGWGPALHPTRLTPNEQVTHITLWSLLSSPLLIGCDMTKLDEFTLSLLTNDEVLDVSQDPLGKQAARVFAEGDLEVWARDLEDGSKAVGLFNRGEMEADVTADFAALGRRGPQAVRDLWSQKDLAVVEGKFTTKIPRHGAALVRLTRR
ncbi:MAG: NPCBM/NEW2 domain-containing protein [Planctomycetes bacterium]|nr:NPCBM/NEW2 domain-containing protein [Planctomycetota bacterium]